MAERLRAPYPAECRGQAIDGVELVLLDADIYGVATRYERNEHELTLSDRNMLSGLLADLDRVWPRLPTEHARSYYGTARELGQYLQAVDRGRLVRIVAGGSTSEQNGITVKLTHRRSTR
jgi:hypothetical protein